MLYIVLGVLREVRPVWFYVLAGTLFVLSQLDYFLLSRVICDGTDMRVDGAFVATVLETAAVGVLYLAWRSITEGASPPFPFFSSSLSHTPYHAPRFPSLGFPSLPAYASASSAPCPHSFLRLPFAAFLRLHLSFLVRVAGY
ncbi:hypothetical protein EIP86_011078 [Pleurotus ostreatoroseus]|nr:hypothetical protein EIP86_008885 [Pleurotus ostreatoroseus]KAF7799836.1 hypothetical protein EIP86_011078 [Pleurotus ostreatoroseus]